jgi:hypothetical protein
VKINLAEILQRDKLAWMRRTLTRKDSDGELGRLLNRYRCPMPFHAVRQDEEGIRRFAEARVEGLDAFVNGLFGDEEALDLPETAHVALLEIRRTTVPTRH